MTYSKTDSFSIEIQELAKLCKVLSHPARIAILKYLSNCNTCISGDISKEIPLSRSTVSQHLQELKNAGLIQGEIEGVKINYCICETVISEKGKELIKFISELSTNKINCC